jgi:hypothetical protein
MKRPVGVTVIAVLDICGAGILTVRDGLLPANRPQGVYLAFLISFVLFSIGLGVGLLKLRNWARSMTVLLSWINLIGAVMFPVREGLAGRRVVDVGQSLGGIFAGGVIWYLSKSEVIAAFRLRENLALQESLNLRYRSSATEGATPIPNSTEQELEPSRNETNPVSVTLFGREIDIRAPRG